MRSTQALSDHRIYPCPSICLPNADQCLRQDCSMVLDFQILLDMRTRGGCGCCILKYCSNVSQFIGCLLSEHLPDVIGLVFIV